MLPRVTGSTAHVLHIMEIIHRSFKYLISCVSEGWLKFTYSKVAHQVGAPVPVSKFPPVGLMDADGESYQSSIATSCEGFFFAMHKITFE